MVFLGTKYWTFKECEALETPQGASAVTCDQTTCMLICNQGFLPTGPRRTRCRWNKKRGLSVFHHFFINFILGYFWNRKLSTCETCYPTDPELDFKNVKNFPRMNCTSQSRTGRKEKGLIIICKNRFLWNLYFLNFFNEFRQQYRVRGNQRWWA